MNPTVSIIIVHYKAKEALLDCLLSIKRFPPKFPYEVLVVDNDEIESLEAYLKNKFKWVRYIRSFENKGYGYGNNLGSRSAKGKYLFLLNPDTKVFPKTIDILVNFLEKNKKASVVSPLLLNEKGRPYQQGGRALGILEGIVCLSFINKVFPNNPISKRYFLLGWDKKDLKEVDVVPGTAFMIRRSLFIKVGGFDEIFFLYFEEFDFCKRIKRLGYRLFITPLAKVLHKGGEVPIIEVIFS